ncbi:unannotated protein [freshwater metagenome]|uniref:Unannotated protein n=1 Tax=freshwater metagenome TaxID=449393 RepID=A0A6J6CLG8_9ZZZZ
MEFDLHTAGGGVELERRLVRGLKLVEGVIDQRVAVAGAEIDGILHRYLWQGLMGAVAHDTVGGPKNALEPISHVSEGVLNRATAGLSVAVVSLGIVGGVGGAATGKILAAGAGRM